jgi:hypothetical protein
MILGKVVRSSSHVDYVCQIYGADEAEAPPAPTDYGFGTFVRIPISDAIGALVGLVYDTVLLNPDFGSLGPRLSPAPDLAVFSPDYLAEKIIAVGITAIGSLAPDDTPRHGVPSLAVQIDTLIERMDDDAIYRFHQLNGYETMQVGYASLLLSMGSPLARHLLLNVIDRLIILFPDQAAHLSVLRGELAWQTVIGPVGGAR